MKKIIHLSDLHIGHEGLCERFRTIVRNIIFEKGDKPEEYIIIITGDLVDDANTPQFRDDVKAEFTRLKEAGFEHILVVPGNHDYGTGTNGDKKFVEVFKQSFFEEDDDYPRKKIIDGIALIGLDSMAEELNWYDKLFAQGEIGEKQLTRLDSILREEEVKSCRKRVIYLHHHPFDSFPFHELKDSGKLRDVLLGVMGDGISIDAILYGHNHIGNIHNGHWGVPRCYDAGTATLKPRGELISWLPWFKIKDATRLIQIEKENCFDYELSLLL